jgi:putative nucleotidyltransferase with HDIG domain
MTSPEQEFKSVPPQRKGDDGALRRRDYSMFANAALVVLSATVATLMLSPSIHKIDLPVSDSDVGKVSPINIRADRDYVLTDEDATERAQVEAAAQVRAFYIHDMDIGDRIAQRINEAFGFIRAVTEGGGRETGDAGTRPGKAAGGQKDKKAAEKVLKAAKPARPRSKPITDPAQLARLKDSRAEFVKILQVPVDDDEFEALARTGFSREAEDGILALITPLMQDMLVSSKDLLAAERNTGITVQRLFAAEQRAEGTIASVGAIKDIDEARRIIDRKADFILADLPRERRVAIASLAKKLIEPNLRYDKAETERRKEEARTRVIPITIALKKGQMIVRDGDKIEKRHLMIFRGMREATKDHRDILMSVGIFVFSMLLIVIPYYFARSFVRKFAPKPRDLVFMQMLLIGLMLMGKLFVLMGGALAEQSRYVPMRAFMFVIPFAAGAMMCRFILNSESALVFSIIASLFAGLSLDGNLWYAGYTFIGSIVAAHGVAQATQRTTVLKAGMLTGLANVAVALALSMFSNEVLWSELAISAVFALGNGLLTAMIVTAFTPAVEVMFGYVTDIKLLEQANLNHPLLKELIVQAPGTYHHSIVVGSLVEAAAEAIGANPLLSRVCAYYHDIGKIKKPLYFGENQKDGLNRLDQNTPPMSALIIKAHVKDGVEIAKAHRLGQPIIDVITQHHGTSIIKYFYQKAKTLAAPGDTVDEHIYRYPGPKPQTREAALVMLADAVEAAARSVPNLDAVRLRGLVQKIINNFFRDQQLSECDLTLKDLHRIAAAFIMVLEGIYHGRPEYQESAVKGPDEKSKTGQNGQARDGSAKTQPPVEQEGDRGEDDEDFKRLGL